MSALSRDLGVSLSAMTQIADRLERASLVKRIAEGNDRRVRCLRLTPRGESIMQRREDVRTEPHGGGLGQAAGQEAERALSALQSLVDACLAGKEQKTKTVTSSVKGDRMRIVIGIVVALLIVACCLTYYAYGFTGGPSSHFKTAEVVRGDLRPFVPATGTLEPVQSIDVGPQVNGPIASFGTVPDPKDPKKRTMVDYGSLRP